jgi:hypothetical protein
MLSAASAANPVEDRIDRSTQPALRESSTDMIWVASEFRTKSGFLIHDL